RRGSCAQTPKRAWHFFCFLSFTVACGGRRSFVLEKSSNCLGSKDLFQVRQSVGFSCTNRCGRDSCTSSRCAGGCPCVSAEAGLPIASTPSCSSSPAGILWRTSQRATSRPTLCNAADFLPIQRVVQLLQHR